MSKPNRFCYTDNKAYYYCQSCPSVKNNGYNSMFCCERCAKIFKVLTDETFNHITTKECKDELFKLGVSLSETFKDGIRKHIEKVFSYVDETDVVDKQEEQEKIKHVSRKRTVKNSEVD